MVKSLHAIDTISGRICPNDERRVALVRAAGRSPENAPLSEADPRSAVARALAEPLEFPALSQSTVPGDRVAIAVGEAVPRAAEVVLGVVDALHTAGVDDDAISIVTTSGDSGRQCLSAIGNGATSVIHTVTHDPDDETNLCLVAVPKRREPLCVNRAIYDADVVLPIGCARINDRGAFDGLFPAFAGAEAVDRYRTPVGHDSASARADMVSETNEAGWLIGVPLVINVVPGPNESVAQVLAGDPIAVSQKSAELCGRQWKLCSPQRASLVIAVVSGGAASQTWANVGRALAAAEPLVAEEGAIAICTNLDEPPGPSLGRLIDCSDLAAAARKIMHEHSDDSWPAWQLVRALQRGPVYLLSQLDADTVEEMGIAPVTDIDELARLAGRHESVIVLDDAQHVVATVDGEDDGQ